MIHTVGELLQALMQQERRVLAGQQITHPPTIGAMYEGLTQQVLRRALPFDVGLRVVSGFAEGADGKRSDQLDCMLVTGEGAPIPYTNMYVYPIDQVLAVIQVKKSLYKSEFEDAFQNLNSVLGLQRKQNPAIGPWVRSAFEVTCGLSLPNNPDSIADPSAEQIYHQLVAAAVCPARILVGYEGYKSVNGLRRGVIEHLKGLIGRPGGGPASIADLILNPMAAVVKMNGLPYATRLDEGNWWSVLVSCASEKPALVLLEVLRTRLPMYVGGGPVLFGEDLDLEAVDRLLDYRYLADKHGWEVRDYGDASKFESRPVSRRPWEPVFLEDSEAALVHWLCRHDAIDISAPPEGIDPSELARCIKRLAVAGLIGRDAAKDTVWRLLTLQCAVVVLPDGRVAAGENISGRLERWIERTYPGKSKFHT